jgi:hypothetical protein
MTLWMWWMCIPRYRGGVNSTSSCPRSHHRFSLVAFVSRCSHQYAYRGIGIESLLGWLVRSHWWTPCPTARQPRNLSWAAWESQGSMQYSLMMWSIGAYILRLGPACAQTFVPTTGHMARNQDSSRCAPDAGKYLDRVVFNACGLNLFVSKDCCGSSYPHLICSNSNGCLDRPLTPALCGPASVRHSYDHDFLSLGRE